MNPLRAKLLEADAKWVDADKDVKDKETALDDLKRQFAEANAAANKAKAQAKARRRKAAATAAAAAAGHEQHNDNNDNNNTEIEDGQAVNKKR